MLNEIVFDADGWSGIIDSEITNKNIARVAQAFAAHITSISNEKEISKVAVAFDGRNHSKPWALLFARILSGNNIKVYLSDKTTPSPVLSYYVKVNNLNAGVMITGGHYEAEYSGIKFKTAFGCPFTASQLEEIQSLIDKELIQADDEKIYQADFHPAYYKHIKNLIDFEAIKNAGLNILFDSMGGAGQQIPENFLSENGIKCKTIFKIAEKDFSGRVPDPAECNLQPLKDELRKDEYSLGIAFDGNASRAGMSMENGKYIETEKLALLLADYIFNQKNHTGHLIKTSSATDKLNQLFTDDKTIIHSEPGGFNNICERMIDEDLAFGCDAEGCFVFKDHVPDTDGIYTGMLITEMLAKSGYKKLSEYINNKQFDIFNNNIIR